MLPTLSELRTMKISEAIILEMALKIKKSLRFEDLKQYDPKFIDVTIEKLMAANPGKIDRNTVSCLLANLERAYKLGLSIRIDKNRNNYTNSIRMKHPHWTYRKVIRALGLLEDIEFITTTKKGHYVRKENDGKQTRLDLAFNAIWELSKFRIRDKYLLQEVISTNGVMHIPEGVNKKDSTDPVIRRVKHNEKNNLKIDVVDNTNEANELRRELSAYNQFANGHTLRYPVAIWDEEESYYEIVNKRDISNDIWWPEGTIMALKSIVTDLDVSAYESPQKIRLYSNTQDKQLISLQIKESRESNSIELKVYNSPSEEGLLDTQEENRNLLLKMSTDPQEILTRAPITKNISPRNMIYKKLDVSLHRVFNDDYETGGRFFGSFTNKSKILRNLILIDSQPVVELDYSTLHWNILYNLKDLDTADPYQLKGYPKELRNFIKEAMNMLLNAKRFPYIALFDAAKKYPIAKDMFINGKYRFDDLVDSIKEQHPAIVDSFYKSKWKELQYRESCLAWEIMSHFMNKGVLVLPVHDSFIVQKQYKEELNSVMKDVYFTKYRFDIGIK
jgi:hypothetical protein